MSEIPLEYGNRAEWQPKSQAEYDRWLAYEEERQNRAHNVIHSFGPLVGWEIIALERWKPGVVRFHARRTSPPWVGTGDEFQMGFAPDAVFANLQLPP